MGLEAGARVSHYRLVRRLGAGGMGEVFLAEDDRLNRLVAIKFLLGAPDDHSRKRLLTEARAVAALDHPNICAVHEIDADPVGGDFIVMPYVEGELLSARLHRGRIPPAETLGLGARIADALRAAHARGIIHRDLKPSNVIVMPSGEPKLLDFGIAKRVETTPRGAEAATTSMLTSPYAVVGTAGYMSPEQVRGQQVDHRSDLFALGCVLYECLTGHHAFLGATSADVAANVLHAAPPPPSTVVPELDASHDALVGRLLQKDPADRFQSATDAMGAIRALEPSRYSGTMSASAVAPAPAMSRRTKVVVLPLAAIAVIAIVLWQGPWFRRLPDAPPEAAQWYTRGVEALREGRFATARSSLEEAVKLFDGYALAYLRLAEAKSELDDAFGANAAMVKAAAAIPNGARLRREEDLRMRAVRSAVLREHEPAIQAYRELAEMHPRDAGGWLDLGRAQEAADKRTEAVESHQKALSLDKQYAAAHLRVGALRVQLADPEGFKDIEEAIRLYHAGGQTEGEAAALIRQGELLLARSGYAAAKASFDRALTLLDAQDLFNRVRAKVGLGRLIAVSGNYSEGEAFSRATIDEATAGGLYATAAQGLTDLGYTLTISSQFDQAEAVLARAIEMAVQHQTRRAEMRARLQRVSLLYERGESQKAIDESVEPLRFYAAQHYPRSEADGKIIVGRAYERLEKYNEALRLSEEALTLATSIKDDGLVALALENVAGQLASQGRIPEALAQRERLESINRAQKNNIALPYDLTNRAELLITLGRGAEAETALQEIDRKAAEGNQAFQRRARRVGLLRAMRASTERRWNDVEAFARVAMTMSDPKAKPDGTWRAGSLLLEHARAQTGKSRLPAASFDEWLEATTAPATRRDLSYWIAQALLARGDREGAHRVATKVLSEPGPAGNAEYRWRMLGIIAVSDQNLTVRAADSATIRDAFREIDALKAAWTTHADVYFARPDLAALRQRLQ